ncbi:MAG: ribosome biogenesis GTP-binding protein YsxC [Deltaproteobacteria bacterium]|nr:ribosome biogenesis GTP-binding protein YsxC [Deltaproteobacteria bacterium]
MSKPIAGGRVRFLGAFPAEVPLPGLPEVAVAGRSNVGKSRCLNALLGIRGVARVSRTPGRTRAVHLYVVENRYVLADLPGYGHAEVPSAVRASWKGLVEGYLAGPRDLRLVLALVDPRRVPGGMDGVLLEGLRQAGIPFLVVATKVDRVPRNDRIRLLGNLVEGYHLDPLSLLPISSVDGTGIEALRAAVDAAVASRRPRRG